MKSKSKNYVTWIANLTKLFLSVHMISKNNLESYKFLAFRLRSRQCEKRENISNIKSICACHLLTHKDLKDQNKLEKKSPSCWEEKDKSEEFMSFLTKKFTNANDNESNKLSQLCLVFSQFSLNYRVFLYPSRKKETMTSL